MPNDSAQDTTAVLQKAVKTEIKAAFQALCLNIASGTSIEVASQEFGVRVNIIKSAYDRALTIAKTEFGT
jgi:hypothetical protein